MGWLIGLLAPRFGQKVATLIAYAAVIGLILFIVWRVVDSYGDRKFNEGAKANQALVDKAFKQLKDDAAASATKADDKAAVRAEVFVEQQTADKEALDAANENGTSPLDALFGA